LGGRQAALPALGAFNQRTFIALEPESVPLRRFINAKLTRLLAVDAARAVRQLYVPRPIDDSPQPMDVRASDGYHDHEPYR
jgi:hypothetical protein